MANSWARTEYKEEVEKHINSWTMIGFSVWLVGFGIEAYGDFVKLQKHNDAKNGKGDQYYYNMSGNWLWAYSRNPNFCGETLCWVGIATMATSRYANWYDDRLSTFIVLLMIWSSPAFTLAIMLFEAVKLTEEKNSKRFEDVVTYGHYKRNTSVLWLLPPTLYAKLPSFIRYFTFFDWEMFYKKSQKTTE